MEEITRIKNVEETRRDGSFLQNVVTFLQRDWVRCQTSERDDFRNIYWGQSFCVWDGIVFKAIFPLFTS